MKRIVNKTIILICLFSLTFTITFADEAKFVKIDSYFGLKNDGTLWKLPYTNDIIIENFGKNFGESSDKADLDYQNEKLRMLNFSGKKIVDFTSYSDHLNNWRKKVSTRGFTYTTDDGITNIYQPYSPYDIIFQHSGAKKYISGFRCGGYISDEGDLYIYGNGLIGYNFANYWLPTKVEGVSNVADAAISVKGAFAIDEQGKLWEVYYNTKSIIAAEADINIDLGTDKLKKICHNFVNAGWLNNGEIALLTQNGKVIINFKEELEEKYIQLDLDKIVDIDSSGVTNYWVFEGSPDYDTNIYGWPGGSHTVMLREDGTVWHVGAIQTCSSEDKDYQSSGLDSLMPVQIKGIDNVVDISVIADDIIMLRSDGSIVKWGATSYKDFHTENPQKIDTRNYSIRYTIDKKNFYINRESKEIDPGRETSAKIYNDRTYIPIRSFIEGIGGSVHWDEETQTITMNLWDKFVKMKVGSSAYTINGKKQEMDVTPIIDNDRTLVPIRFAAEAFGFTVEYSEERFGKYIDLFYHEVLL